MRIATMALILLAALIPLITFGSTAGAEVELLAFAGPQGVVERAWPKLSPIPGWAQDEQASVRAGINAFVPEGEHFESAHTVMYARAIRKADQQGVDSLSAYIERDREKFAARHPGMQIEEAPKLETADGRALRSLTFTPSAQGFWERVAYGEEGDFYLVFTISAGSQHAYATHAAAFERLVRSYRENPPRPGEQPVAHPGGAAEPD